MPSLLEPIIKFSMSPQESKAFKVALLWERLYQKEFPDFTPIRLRKRGDPRKSLLFRYCYKMVQETEGILKEKDYKNFIVAQFSIFKCLPNSQARIDPAILTGPRAWKRWKYWEYLCEKTKLIPEDVIIKACPTTVITELKRTRRFLFDKFGGVPTKSLYLSNRSKVINWVNNDRISKYYAAMSPFFREIGEDIDLGVYIQSVTPELEKFFRSEFNYEFSTNGDC